MGNLLLYLYVCVRHSACWQIFNHIGQVLFQMLEYEQNEQFPIMFQKLAYFEQSERVGKSNHVLVCVYVRRVDRVWNVWLAGCACVCVFECKLCKAKGCWGQVAPLIILRKYCALTKLLHSHETRQFLQKFSIKRVNAGESLSEPDHCPSTNRECCLLANIVFALLTKSSAASRLTTVFTISKIWFIFGKTDYFQQQYKLKIIIFSFNYFKMTLHSFSILVAYDIRKIR